MVRFPDSEKPKKSSIGMARLFLHQSCPTPCLDVFTRVVKGHILEKHIRKKIPRFSMGNNVALRMGVCPIHNLLKKLMTN